MNNSIQIPKRYKNFKRENSTGPKWLQTYEMIRDIMLDGVVIVICGKRGTGKTQIAWTLIKCMLIKFEKTAMYRKAYELFLESRGIFEDHKTINKYLNPELLVIDAFEVRGETDFENKYIDHLVDMRYDRCKTTIIITNDAPEVMKKKLGPSISSRIKDGGGVFEMNWESFRGKKKDLIAKCAT